MKRLTFRVIFFAIVIGIVTNCSFSQSMHLFAVGKDNSMTDKCCRVGFIDESGNLKIDHQFYYANEFSEGLTAVILVRGEKWGYADNLGRIVIKPQFDEASSFSNGIARVAKDGETYFILKDGKKAFDTGFYLLGFSECLSPARFSKKWGFVDSNGKIVIPFEFQSANPFSENLAAVTQNDRIGYIDSSGKWVIPPRYSLMNGLIDPLFLPNFSEGFAVYRDANKYGFIDRRGAKVIAATFDRAEGFSEGMAVVRLESKIGYLKKDGQFAIVPKYEAGGKFSQGLAAIRVNGKWGYVDMTGRVQILPQYDEAEHFEAGLAKVTKHDEKGGSNAHAYVNKNGTVIYSWKQ